MGANHATRSSNRGRWVWLALTAIAYLALWFLFELQRIPEPPSNIGTFLGTEVHAIPPLMCLIIVGWLVCSVCIASRIRLTVRDLLLVTVIAALLVLVSVKVVKYPSWPVAKETIIGL